MWWTLLLFALLYYVLWGRHHPWCKNAVAWLRYMRDHTPPPYVLGRNGKPVAWKGVAPASPRNFALPQEDRIAWIDDTPRRTENEKFTHSYRAMTASGVSLLKDGPTLVRILLDKNQPVPRFLSRWIPDNTTVALSDALVTRAEARLREN